MAPTRPLILRALRSKGWNGAHRGAVFGARRHRHNGTAVIIGKYLAKLSKEDLKSEWLVMIGSEMPPPLIHEIRCAWWTAREQLMRVEPVWIQAEVLVAYPDGSCREL